MRSERIHQAWKTEKNNHTGCKHTILSTYNIMTFKEILISLKLISISAAEAQLTFGPAPSLKDKKTNSIQPLTV